VKTTPLDLATLEERLGYSFRERGFLLAALTHRSYLNETWEPDAEDNERLEFLGDALLDFIAGDLLYHELPDAPEGELTAVRAALVCEPALAKLASGLNLGAFMRLGKGEAASGGRERSGLLCDAFEAVVGALFLDGGVEAVRDFVTPLFREELRTTLDGSALKDSKSRLQETSQRIWQVTPRYETVAAEGPDHAKEFVVQAVVGDRVWGQGSGRSKSAAARRAALEALNHIRAELGESSL
jgi:ribonuclease-3